MMSWMCVSRSISRRARCARSPSPVCVGVQNSWPAVLISGRIFFHAQPADHAPCATTNVAMLSSRARLARDRYTVPVTNRLSGEGMRGEGLPPFRADHVGSLLRPRELLQARAKHAAGRIAPDELRRIEDR